MRGQLMGSFQQGKRRNIVRLLVSRKTLLQEVRELSCFVVRLRQGSARVEEKNEKQKPGSSMQHCGP